MLLDVAVLWLRTKSNWRNTYKHLFIAATMYVLASQAINAAIIRGKYHTGGMYDLPFCRITIVVPVGYGGSPGDGTRKGYKRRISRPWSIPPWFRDWR